MRDVKEDVTSWRERRQGIHRQNVRKVRHGRTHNTREYVSQLSKLAREVILRQSYVRVRVPPT
eukprot:5048574-Pleurochrysis_carterae.AAC.1